jgi:Co/Zn/Cd efflux system component
MVWKDWFAKIENQLVTRLKCLFVNLFCMLLFVDEPGARHWIKIKKDYLHGAADTADLVCIMFIIHIYIYDYCAKP